MARTPNTINARIALEGGADVTRAFADIREAVTSALQQIQGALQRVNLQLPGAEQAKAQLAGVGEAGEQAASKVKTAFEGAGEPIARTGQAAQTAGGQIAQAGQQAQASAGGIASGFQAAASNVGSSLLKIAAAVGALALAGNALGAKLAKDFADTADELNDNAKAANLTAEAYQRLKTHADEAGVSDKNFSSGLTDLNKLAKEFAKGGAVDLGSGMTAVTTKAKTLVEEVHGQVGPVLADTTVTIVRMGKSSEVAAGQVSETAAKLRQFGINLAEIVGKNPDQILQVLADRYNKLGSETQKAAFAQAFFTRGSKEWQDLLKDGGATLAKGSEDAREFSAAQIKAGVDLKKALDDLSEAFTFAKNLVGALLAPGATAKAEWLTSLIDGARKLVVSFIDASGLKDKLLAGKFDFFKDFDLDKFQKFLDGKGAVEATGDAIKAGADKITAAFAALSGVVDKTDVDTSTALAALDAAIKNLLAGKGSIDAVKTALAALDEEIEEGTPAAAKLKALQDVIGSFGGGSASVGMLATALKLLRGISSDLATLWTDVLVPAGEAIFAAFDTVAAKLNELFGTNISGRFLIVATVVGTITGAFSLLGGMMSSVVGIAALLIGAFAAFASGTPALDGIRKKFSEIGVDVNGLVAAVGDFLTGVWKDLVAAFQGRDVDIKNSWVKDLKDFFTSIPGIITVALTAFLVFRRAIVALTPLVNALFGTALNPTQVGAIAIIGSLSGLLGGLVTALVGAAAATTILVNAFGILGVTLGSPVVIIGALTAALLLLSDTLRGSIATQIQQVGKDWNDVKKTFQEKGFIAALLQDLSKINISFDIERAKQLWTQDFETLKKLFGDDIKTLAALFGPLWEQLKADWVATMDLWADRFDDFIDDVKEKWQEFVAFLKNLLPKLPDLSPSAGPAPSRPEDVPLGRQRPARLFDQIPEDANASLDPDQRHTIEDRRNEQTLEQLETQGQAMLAKLAEFAAKVGEEVTAAFATLELAAQAAAQNVVQTFTAAGDLIGQLFASSVQRAVDGVGQVIAGIGQAIAAMLATLQAAIGEVAAAIDAAIAGILERLEAALAKAREVAAAVASGGGGGGTGNGGNPQGDSFDGGGFTGFGGRLEPAGIVHRLEHVQPANVVARPGVLAFLEALRRSGGDLLGTIARFSRGFSLGGLVDGIGARLAVPALPGFAAGGLVPAPAGAPLHLGTIDMRTDGGTVRLTVVRDDAVAQLHEANVRRVMARIGKPARGT